MTYSRAILSCFRCGSFSFVKLWLHSQTNNILQDKWAVTPIWVLNRLPMHPKTRKFPTGNLP